ncbi:MAG: REP-associated tyrosine transposase [Candidatus Binataceae bacterium]
MDPWKSPELRFRRRHLPHLEVPDATYFVSFSCLHRLELPPEARDLVMAEIRALDQDAIDLDAAVVIPDHVHAIFRLIGTLSLIQVLKSIKGRTAHRINEITGRRGQVWAQESFDHIVRGESEWQEKIEYIRQNPQKKGLVSSPEQYKWLYISRTEFIPSDKNHDPTKLSAKNEDLTKNGNLKNGKATKNEKATK